MTKPDVQSARPRRNNQWQFIHNDSSFIPHILGQNLVIIVPANVLAMLLYVFSAVILPSLCTYCGNSPYSTNQPIEFWGSDCTLINRTTYGKYTSWTPNSSRVADMNKTFREQQHPWPADISNTPKCNGSVEHTEIFQPWPFFNNGFMVLQIPPNFRLIPEILGLFER